MKSRNVDSNRKRSRSLLKNTLNRLSRIEQLEDRRLMAVMPDANGYYYPPVGIRSADFTEMIPQGEYARRSAMQFGPGGSGSGGIGNGESSGPLTLAEVEPNNTPRTAQFIPFGTGAGQNQVVTINGRINQAAANTNPDEDYFAMDLRAGDLVDFTLTGANAAFDASFVTAGGSTIVGRNTPAVGYGGANSPLSTTGLVTFSYMVPSDGRYTLRIADGTGAYVAKLTAYRSTYEKEAVGTKQIVFIDFDGATIQRQIFGVPGTGRLSPLSSFMNQFGLNPEDESKLIDEILKNIYENYLQTLPFKAKNGWYSLDGQPGHFDVEFRNSRDNADPWGLPNVSRLIIGGTSLELGIPVRGIAQSVDIGNFAREETAVVLPEAYVLEDAVNIARVSSISGLQVLAVAMGATASHEMGHFFGAVHQENGNGVDGQPATADDVPNLVLSLMDSGGLPLDVSRVGVGNDGIYGTTDDIDIDFGVDDYASSEGWFGREDTAAVMAFGLSTGMRAATVSGVQFNDKNSNGRIDTGEQGLAGWTVFADLNGSGLLDSGDVRTSTGADGSYKLLLPAGTYALKAISPAGWVGTVPKDGIQAVSVQLDQVLTGINFGFVQPVQSVTGYKWNDLNGDGIRDTNEPPLEGIYIFLDLDGDKRPDIGEPTSRTKSDGSYVLTPPAPGAYQIRELVDPGYLQTFPTTGVHVVNYDGINPLVGFDFGNRFALDFGDAPSKYPVTAAQDGASAGFTPGLSLGANIDIDVDGQPNSTATGDNIVGLFDANNQVINDEDGIVFQSQIIADGKPRNLSAFLTNTAGGDAYLNGWIDLNQDGDWTDDGEQIVSNKLLSVGQNSVPYSILPTASLGGTFARFRLSQDLKTTSTGRSLAGEVEDYAVNIVGSSDTAVDDAFTVNRNSVANTLDVLANDFRVNNETLQIASVSGGNNGGIIQISAGKNSIRYTPRNGFIGRETFTYTMKNSAGDTDTATVTVDVTFSFDKPIAVDDSYNIAKNAIGVPLNVLANDVEGKDGALQIVSVTSPDQGGTALVGSGNQSIRYTPRRGFIGLETFTYTAADSAGHLTSAIISLHVGLPEDTNDVVGISVKYVDMAGNDLPGAVQQGTKFKAQIFVDDLRDTATLFGVFSAYFDLLYNSSLATPSQSAAGSAFNFQVSFAPPYNNVQRGANDVPGLINELGATSSVFDLNNPDAVLFATITFDALAPGLFEIASDPAEDPNNDTDTTLMGANIVPVEQILFGRSSIEIVGNGFEFPVAVDDSVDLIPNTFDNIIDVLGNDSTGSTGSIKLRSVTQPLNGSVFIDDNGTSIFSDDVIKYTPNNQFTQSDQFTYTIQDDRGFTSTGTVTVHGVDDAIIDLGLQVTDLLGNPITQIAIGQQFQLKGTVKDLRTTGANLGVFAAFQDILVYNSVSGGVTVNASTTNALGFQVTFGPNYNRVPNGDIRLSTLINEIGSVQTGDAPLGNDSTPYTQFIVTLTANKVGTARFVGDPADVSPFHDSLMFEPPEPVTYNRIKYHSTTINVVAGTGGAGGEGFTNPNNRFDVNNDGFVSPIDVLLIINRLNQGGSGKLGGGEGEGAKYFVDVNADGFLSAIDALQVINTLNTGGSNGEGEGEGESASAAPSSSTSNLSAIATSAVGLGTPRTSVYGPVTYGSSNRSNPSSLSDYIASHEETDSIDSLIDSLANDVLGNWTKKKNS